MFETLNGEIRRTGQPPVHGTIVRDLRTPSVASQEAFEVQLGGMSRRVQVPLSAVYPHPSARYNAGTHVETIRMRYEDYENLVHPVVAKVSHAS